MSNKKVIYFTKSETTTPGEEVQIASVPHKTVVVRNSLANSRYGDALESCDFVAGSPPQAYLEAYPFLAQLNCMSNVIVAAGDSRTAGTYSTSATTSYFESKFPLPWAAAMCNGAAILREIDYGVGGDTTATLLARWQTVLADSAPNIFLLIGANDRGSANLTLAQSISNMVAMLDAAGAAGKMVFLADEMPYGALTGTQKDNHLAFSKWLGSATGALLRRPWVVSVPTFAAVCKYGETNLFATDFSTDGLHPVPIGAFHAGRALATALRDKMAPLKMGRFAHSWAELCSNPNLTGTSGSTGSGVSGQLATSHSLTLSSAASGVTVAASKVIAEDGTEYQKLVFSGTPSAADGRAEFRTEIDLGAVSTGDLFVVGCEFIANGLQNIAAITTETQLQPNAIRSRALDVYSGSLIPKEMNAHFYHVTPISFPIDKAVNTNVRAAVNIMFGTAAAVSGTVLIKSLKARKV